MKDYSFDYMLELFGGARYLLRNRIEADLKTISECSKYRVDCLYTIANAADGITAYNELTPLTYYYRVKDFMK